jgi:hypothetical protein
MTPARRGLGRRRPWRPVPPKIPWRGTAQVVPRRGTPWTTRRRSPPEIAARHAAAKIVGWCRPPWPARHFSPAQVARRGERAGLRRGWPGSTAFAGGWAGWLGHPRPARRGGWATVALRRPCAGGWAWIGWLCPEAARRGGWSGRRSGAPSAAPRWRVPLRVGRAAWIIGWPGGAAPTGPVVSWILAPLGRTAPVALARIVIPAAPAVPAAASRRSRVGLAGSIWLAAPDRVLAAVAPAEKPAASAAALVGRVRERLEDPVQAVQVGHQAAAALRRLAAARRVVGAGPVGAALVGAASPGIAPPGAAGFAWFRLHGARDDPAPARPSLVSRIGRLEAGPARPGRRRRAGR